IGEKEGEDKNKVLQEQLKECLKSIEKKEFEKIIIAYEPVWAIGTGKNCSIEETMNSVLLIKKIIADLYKKEIAEKIRIIYGGSVNGKNSREYILKGGVSGLLVGGASLDVNEFTQIVKSVD
ncbi:MAG: triose-phosphate isomerase, partial [Patescibacteria group bacterium]